MTSISGKGRVFGSLLLIFALSGMSLADTLRLKDGSIIKGKIVSFGSGKFTVSMGSGTRKKELSFAAADVESIQFDENEPPRISDTPNRNASYKQAEPVAPAVVPAEKPQAVVTAKPRPETPRPTGEKMKPIVWQVKVLADETANGWTNSGWVVKKGQRIRISGEGDISLGRGQKASASGLPELNDAQKLLKNVPTGALIAVIGDDNNDFIYVGSEREFTASRDGALFLGINEGHLGDNSGSFNVKIEILPDPGS